MSLEPIWTKELINCKSCVDKSKLTLQFICQKFGRKSNLPAVGRTDSAEEELGDGAVEVETSVEERRIEESNVCRQFALL